MQGQYKVCPNCQQKAVLSMATCARCGYQYQTTVVMPAARPPSMATTDPFLRRMILFSLMCFCALTAFSFYLWIDVKLAERRYLEQMEAQRAAAADRPQRVEWEPSSIPGPAGANGMPSPSRADIDSGRYQTEMRSGYAPGHPELGNGNGRSTGDNF